MTYGNSSVPAPDIDDRRAAAVIGGRHAHEVLLLKAVPYGLDPIAPIGMSAATERPERRLSVRHAVPGAPLMQQLEGTLGPTHNPERMARDVSIEDLVKSQSRVVGVQLHLHGLLDFSLGRANEPQPGTPPQRPVDVLPGLVRQSKLIDVRVPARHQPIGRRPPR